MLAKRDSIRERPVHAGCDEIPGLRSLIDKRMEDAKRDHKKAFFGPVSHPYDDGYRPDCIRSS